MAMRSTQSTITTDTRPLVDQWLPDETLFSLASRQHVLAGSISATATCAQVFGHSRRGSAHDLPSNLAHFTRFSRGRFGNAEVVGTDHTILPYYLIYRSTEVRRATWKLCLGGEAAGLKAKLGVLATRFGAAHPLKACPQCMVQDALIHDVAYWHRSHQLPGIWICPIHGMPLHTANLKWNGIERFAFCLPSHASVDESHPLKDVAPAQLQLASIAKTTLAMLEFARREPISLTRSRMVYREALNELGAVRGEQQVCARALVEILVPTISRITAVGEFANLAHDSASIAASFLPLVRGHREVPHPLKHLLLITALFPTWNDFEQRYRATALAKPTPRPRSTESRTPEADAAKSASKRVQLLRLIRDESLSISAAARAVGVATGTAQAWAAACGIACARRPKTLAPHLRDDMVSALAKGGDRDSLARAHGVSIQTVTRILRTEPGLHEAWAAGRFERLKQQTRCDWSAALKSHDHLTTKQLRAQAPATYAWLYRHDKEWLQSQPARSHASSERGRLQVDWAARDKQLACEIEAAGLRHCDETCGNSQMTLALLATYVPTLRRRLSKLKKLPLSQMAIQKTLFGRPSTSRAPADPQL